MAPIVLAGHSHMVALAGDMLIADATLLPVASFSEISALYGPWPRDSLYWERLGQVATGAKVAIVWGGNDHNILYFFQSHRPFDFWSRSVTQMMGRFPLVPQSMVREQYRPNIKRLSSLIASIQENSPAGIAIVGTPPPKEDADELRRLFSVDTYFVELAAKTGRSPDDVKITPAHIRLKLWYLLQEMMEEAASKSGARFISVPRETMDADGYLRREFWANDVTHANRAYGEIMVRKLLAEIGDQ